MSEKFKVWRTDVEDEAVAYEVEAHNAYEAARKFAEEEYARDSFEDIEFELEAADGRQFVARADAELEPTFDISCLSKKRLTARDKE